jgi:hypothetical protein
MISVCRLDAGEHPVRYANALQVIIVVYDGKACVVGGLQTKLQERSDLSSGLLTEK